VAVGIDGELTDIELLVADDALDGGTGLALVVEHEGLRVEDAPAIADVRVETDRGCLPARIEAGLPDALGGLEAHHVGGRKIGAAPGGRDRMAVHERQDRTAGLGEPALIGRPAHRLTDGGCGYLRDHAGGLGRRERGAVGEDAGVDHQELVGRPRLAAEHDPAEADLGVDGEDQLRQLRLADASIERGAQLGELRILVLGCERREVQLVVDAKRAGLGSGGHGRHPGLGALHERLEERHGIGGQTQPAKVRAALRLPAFGRDEEPVPAAKRKAVVDPDGSVPERPAQGQQRRHLERAECALAIGAREGRLPDAPQEYASPGGETALLVGVEIVQPMQRREDRVAICRLPRQPNQRGQKRAHRAYAVDEAFPDEVRAAGRSASPVRDQQGLQLLPNPGIGDGGIGDDRADGGEQLLVKRRPVALRSVGTDGGTPPQVGNLAPDHHEQTVRGHQQAIAHEAGGLDAARGLPDQRPGGRRAAGQAPGMTTKQIVGEIAQPLVYAHAIEPLDAIDHLLDLARRMARRRRPQPRLQGRSQAVRLGECRSPLHHETRFDRLIDAPCQLRLVLAPGGGDHRAQASFVNDEQAVIVEPAPREPEQALAVIGSGELLPQHADERAAVMVSDPLKPERVAGDLLVLDQRRRPPVHRA
jgi:hypothetical protein